MPGALTRRLYCRRRARDATPLRGARLGRRRGLGARRRRDPARARHREALRAERAASAPRTIGRAPTGRSTRTPPTGGARLPARTLPAGSSRDRAGFVPDLCRRFAAHLAGVPTSYDEIPIDLDWATPLQRELRGRGPRDSVGRGRLLRRARRARGPPGGGAGSGLVLRREPVLAHHPLPSRRRGERHRRVRRRRPGAEAAPARARRRAPVSSGSLADDVRAELAAIAPNRRCDRLAEISALFHTAGARAPPRAGRGRIPPRPRLVRGRAARVRRFSPSFASRRRSAPTRRAPSTGRRATSSMSRAPSTRSPRSPKRACSTASTGRSTGRPAGSSRAPAAAAPTCGARSSAAAR